MKIFKCSVYFRPRADVLEVRRRYANIYIPSDFFFSNFRWVDAFPPDKPFTLNKPSSFHIMNKDIEPLVKNEAVLEPPDADYLFSAKVNEIHMYDLLNSLIVFTSLGDVDERAGC